MASQTSPVRSTSKVPARPTSDATRIKTSEAIRRWEEKTGKSAKEAQEMMLHGHYPPIYLMDNSLQTLLSCQKLSLSTNMIETIGNLSGLNHLRILSLGRNLIKSLLPLEVLSGTLEELWISYNLIVRFDGILNMKRLRVLYISNNLVKDWREIERLSSIRTLEDLVLNGNPIAEQWKNQEDLWIQNVQKTLPSLKKLDGLFIKNVIDDE